jgi:S-(hydroxymethyl)glutathione dehydrogenase/alcohol dehydrogenase
MDRNLRFSYDRFKQEIERRQGAGGGVMRAQAVVVRSVADGPRLEEVEVDPPGRGEVLVRVAASGICGSDLHVVHGRSVIDAFPMVLGHEGAGVVEAVGDGVSSVAAGDHVVLALYGPCGACDHCRTGRFVLCDGTARVAAIGGRMADGSTRMRLGDGSTLFPMVGIGSLAELAVLRADQVVAVDPAIPLDVICLAGCGATTGLGSVFNVADVRPGESVAVVGCGGVGLNVVQGARIAGAGPIVAVDTNPRKLELAQHLGATHTVDPSDGGVVAAVQRVVPGGVDVAFEVVGVPALVAEAFLATRPGGRCVMVGSPPAGEPIPIDGRALFGERRLLGTTGGSNVPARDIPRIARLYADGQLDLDTLVSARRPLADFASSIAETERGEVARSVVVMG